MRLELVGLGEVLADGDVPGVVGVRRLKPDDLVRLVERFRLLVCGLRILPGRVGIDAEEEAGIAGVFGVDVDLARGDGGPHDLGRPELDLVLDRQAGMLEHLDDHVAEERALGIDLRGDHDLVAHRPGGAGRCHNAEHHAGGNSPKPLSHRQLPDFASDPRKRQTEHGYDGNVQAIGERLSWVKANRDQSASFTGMSCSRSAPAVTCDLEHVTARHSIGVPHHCLAGAMYGGPAAATSLRTADCGLPADNTP